MIKEQAKKIICTAIENAIQEYESNSCYKKLLRSRETIIWDLFHNECLRLYKEGLIDRHFEKNKKRIYVLNQYYFTFNKFSEEIRRTTPDSQLTINFVNCEAPFEIEENKSFEFGYIYFEEFVKIFIKNKTEHEELIIIQLNNIKIQNVLIENDNQDEIDYGLKLKDVSLNQNKKVN